MRDRAHLVRPIGDHGVAQHVEGRLIDLVAPFTSAGGQCGPDLHRPRPTLRIVPGKLSGSPHVAHTRVETQVIAALASRGLPLERILDLYPFVERVTVEQSIDLEHQLSGSLATAA